MCYVLLDDEHCELECANPRGRLPFDERCSISRCPWLARPGATDRCNEG
jgi:hypothetical protein